MKGNTLFRNAVIGISSVVSLFFGHSLHANPGVIKEMSKNGKKHRPIQTQKDVAAVSSTSAELQDPTKNPARQFPWRCDIVTTTFWVGEKPTENNPVPNDKSSWDSKWAQNYGGTDTPDHKLRTSEYIPVGFIPRQNPFYIALPYNDKTLAGHKAEAAQAVPWFAESYQGPEKSVCKGRWIAIRKGGRTCYAQWEDVGPFRTDHWQYVFGEERPKPNLNQGAGLDVSPAVRDFLNMDDSDITDWKFVDFKDVPPGPWARYGDNNTFVLNRRAEEKLLASATSASPERFAALE